MRFWSLLGVYLLRSKQEYIICSRTTETLEYTRWQNVSQPHHSLISQIANPLLRKQVYRQQLNLEPAGVRWPSAITIGKIYRERLC